MYQPPVDDYEFLMRNVVDVEQILAAADDGISVDDVSDILGHAGEFAVEVFARAR